MKKDCIQGGEEYGNSRAAASHVHPWRWKEDGLRVVHDDRNSGARVACRWKEERDKRNSLRGMRDRLPSRHVGDQSLSERGRQVTAAASFVTVGVVTVTVTK